MFNFFNKQNKLNFYPLYAIFNDNFILLYYFLIIHFFTENKIFI